MKEKRRVVLNTGEEIPFSTLKKGMKFKLYEDTGEEAHPNCEGRDQEGFLTAASDAYVNKDYVGEIEVKI